MLEFSLSLHPERCGEGRNGMTGQKKEDARLWALATQLSGFRKGSWTRCFRESKSVRKILFVTFGMPIFLAQNVKFFIHASSPSWLVDPGFEG
jgi:hypothetical protein